MSVIDDLRKLLQDFVAPELASIRGGIEALGKISDARFAAEQMQYATLLTHLEIVKEQSKDTRDSIRELSRKIDSLIEDRQATHG